MPGRTARSLLVFRLYDNDLLDRTRSRCFGTLVGKVAGFATLVTSDIVSFLLFGFSRLDRFLFVGSVGLDGFLVVGGLILNQFDDSI